MPGRLSSRWIKAAVFGAVLLLVWLGVDALTRPAAPALPAGDVPQPAPAIRSQRPRTDQTPQAAITALSADDTIEDKLKTLSAAGDPDQLLDAFNLIGTCLQLESTKEVKTVRVQVVPKAQGLALHYDVQMEGEQKLRSLRKFCASMTGRTRLDRYQYLRRAVEGDSAGALTLYIASGPQGDYDAYKNNPTDPAVEAWHTLALEKLQQRVDQGYPDTLLFAVTGYTLLGEPPSAEQIYKLYLGTNYVLGAINSGQAPYPATTLDDISKNLTSEQKLAAEQGAQRILSGWKQRQK